MISDLFAQIRIVGVLGSFFVPSGSGEGEGLGEGEGEGLGEGEGEGLGEGEGDGDGAGLVVSTVKVTVLLASFSSRFVSPAPSVNWSLAT